MLSPTQEACARTILLRAMSRFACLMPLFSVALVASAGCGRSALPIEGPTPCGLGVVQCGGLCVDTRFDPQNCGSCGHACDPGQFCNIGRCVDGPGGGGFGGGGGSFGGGGASGSW